MVILQPASGLCFPAVETLREEITTWALEGTWAAPKCPAALCTLSLPVGPQGPAVGGRGRPGSLWASPQRPRWPPLSVPQHLSLRTRSFSPELVFQEKLKETAVWGPLTPPHGPARSSLPGATPSTAVSAGSAPRCAILDCSHVCGIDYTAVLGLGELLEDFRRQGVTLAFVGLQVGVPAQLALVAPESALEGSATIVPMFRQRRRGPEKLINPPEATQLVAAQLCS